MTALDTAFAATALVAVAGGLLAVTTRHVVHAALWLVVALPGSRVAARARRRARRAAPVPSTSVLSSCPVLFALMLTRAPIGPDLAHAVGPWRTVGAAPCWAAPSRGCCGVGCCRSPASRSQRADVHVGPGRRAAVRHLGVALRAALPAAARRARRGPHGGPRDPARATGGRDPPRRAVPARGRPRRPRRVRHRRCGATPCSSSSASSSCSAAGLVLLVTTQAAGGRPVGGRQRAAAVRHHHRRRRGRRRARRRPRRLPAARGASTSTSRAVRRRDALAARRSPGPRRPSRDCAAGATTCLAPAGGRGRRRLTPARWPPSAGRADGPTGQPRPGSAGRASCAVPLDLAQRPRAGRSWPSWRSSPSPCRCTRRWYLETDDRYPRFAATVSLFTAAMLLVVVSGDLVLTVVGWEVMGWCSYLLIGHWSRRHTARRAAHKAFLVTRVADIGFVLGVIGLAAGAGSTTQRSATCAADRVVDTWSGARRSMGTRAGIPSSYARRHRGARQVGPAALPGLARRRHGGPDAGQRPHPRGDHGRRRHRRARRPLPAARRRARCRAGARRRRLGDDAARRGARLRAERPQAAARRGRRSARSASCSRPSPPHRRRRARTPACSTCGRTPSSRRCSSSRSAGPAVAAGGTAATRPAGHRRWRRRCCGSRSCSACCPWPACPSSSAGLSKEHVVAVSWEGAVESGPGVVVLVALLLTAAVTAAYCTRAYLLLTAHVARRSRPQPRRSPPGRSQGVLAVLVGLSVVGGLVAAHRRLPGRRRPRLVWMLDHGARHRRRRRRRAARRLRPRPGRRCWSAGSSRTPTRGLGVDALYLRRRGHPGAAARPARRVPRHRGHRRLRARHRRRHPGRRLGGGPAPSAASGPARPSASSSRPSSCSAIAGVLASS